MDNQEAIEFLKNMIDREAIGFVCPEREGDVAIWQYHVEALQMAISALEKQVPKKPNYYKEEDIFVKNLSFVYTYCPVCEKEIVMDDMYCGCCGQAIDWGNK